MLFKRKKKVLRRFSIVNLEQDTILQRRNDRTRSFDVIKVAESDEEKTVLMITEKKANKIVKCLNEIFDKMFNEQGWFAKCLDEPDPFDLQVAYDIISYSSTHCFSHIVLSGS